MVKRLRPNFDTTMFIKSLLLEPLTYNQYTIQDPLSFCEELKHFNTNLIMASFDVKSLFTNITLQERIVFCVQKLFEEKNYIVGLS